jgi:uncharacterized protein YvpB
MGILKTIYLPEFLYIAAIVSMGFIVIYWVIYFILRTKFGTKRILRWRLYITLFFVILFIFFVYSAYSIAPKVIFPTDPSLTTSIISREQPIVLRLDRKVDIANLQFEITPSLQGEWRSQQNFWDNAGAKLVFVPSQSALLETRYSVSITGIKNILSKTSSNYLFSIETPGMPALDSIALADGDQNVLPNQGFVAIFDKPISDATVISFELIPPVQLSVAVEGQVYTVTPKEPLRNATKYILKIYRENYQTDYLANTKILISKDELSSINFETVEAPGIAKYSPNGDQVLPLDAIIIQFVRDMDKGSVEKAFSISPEVKGSFLWSGNKSFLFQPTILTKETKYTVTLATTATSLDGSSLEAPLSFSFNTIGAVDVLSTLPIFNATKVGIDQKISITFDQAVNKTSAQEKFTIAPLISGTFSWNDKTMIFSHSAFAYSTKYTVGVAEGVISDTGLNSKKAYSFSFTTTAQNLLLDVVSYRQVHMYSCMISAAKSVLGYRGVAASEAEIITKVGYDNTAWSGTWNEAGSVWGDPSVGIVGSLDGKADNIGWGYGTHWEPIAKAIEAYGVSTETKSNMTVSDLAEQISAGNPVIIWWVNGVWPTYEVNWSTSAGKNIRAVNGMHVAVVRGFTGTPDNPATITVTDSGYGYPGKAYDVATFKAKWGWFGNTGITIK